MQQMIAVDELESYIDSIRFTAVYTEDILTTYNI